MMPAATAASDLVLSARWAALATVRDAGEPSGSMVAYAVEGDARHLLVFLSGLAAHTGHLLTSRRCALVVSEADPGEGDPQTLARVALTCSVEAIARDDPGFTDAFAIYVARLPEARARLALPDFTLFRLTVASVRFIGGFARAETFSGVELSGRGHSPI
ncbi:pyridoxamine 5'-phosphate oxidase family protein [bacterium]|nr:pyridoxamine 5'-phosphate oxidase family protein [bacterium]